MSRIMIIDSNALGHVVKHSTKELSWRGDKTGVIYGFLQKLFKIQSDVNADQVIFCWDAIKDTLFRKEIFPDYKKQDKEPSQLDKELDRIARPQFIVLRTEVLPAMGFANNLIMTGLEADDIIAQLVLQYKRMNDFVIVSRDNDLHQLLEEDKVTLFDPVKMGYFTEKIFREKWGIEPKDWEQVKAIAGCAGDGVPGVPGVKEKTAIKFLKGETNPDTKAHQNILLMEEQCIFNIRLVKIPWEGTPSFDIFFDDIDVNGFIDICKKYGLNSFLEGGKVEEFSALFRR